MCMFARTLSLSVSRAIDSFGKRSGYSKQLELWIIERSKSLANCQIAALTIEWSEWTQTFAFLGQMSLTLWVIYFLCILIICARATQFINSTKGPIQIYTATDDFSTASFVGIHKLLLTPCSLLNTFSEFLHRKLQFLKPSIMIVY